MGVEKQVNTIIEMSLAKIAKIIDRIKLTQKDKQKPQLANLAICLEPISCKYSKKPIFSRVKIIKAELRLSFSISSILARFQMYIMQNTLETKTRIRLHQKLTFLFVNIVPSIDIY